MKPSNLLINSECLIKIADFGLARSISQTEEKDTIMTEYVATRWYRAPEIVLGSNKYSKAVDMWSVGCILAELINGKALFPGKSSLNQIELILEVIGKPSIPDIKAIDSENAISIINSINIRYNKVFEQHFNDKDPEVLDFLRKCLEFNPHKRMTVDEALAHPLVQEFRDPSEEIVLTKPIEIKLDDNNKLSLDKYRYELYEDIKNKKKEQKEQWRKKYLKQLGINVKEKVSKEHLRQIVSRKKPSQTKTLKNPNGGLKKEKSQKRMKEHKLKDSKPKERSKIKNTT